MIFFVLFCAPCQIELQCSLQLHPTFLCIIPMTKSVKKVVKAVRRPKGVESYKTYIFKVMKQLHPEARISKKGRTYATKEYKCLRAGGRVCDREHR